KCMHRSTAARRHTRERDVFGREFRATCNDLLITLLTRPLLLDRRHTPAAARPSTPDKIEVSEWLGPDGFSIDCAAQQVLKVNVRFGSKADVEALSPDVRYTPESGRSLARCCERLHSTFPNGLGRPGRGKKFD